MWAMINKSNYSLQEPLYTDCSLNNWRMREQSLDFLGSLDILSSRSDQSDKKKLLHSIIVQIKLVYIKCNITEYHHVTHLFTKSIA